MLRPGRRVVQNRIDQSEKIVLTCAVAERKKLYYVIKLSLTSQMCIVFITNIDAVD